MENIANVKKIDIYIYYYIETFFPFSFSSNISGENANDRTNNSCI